MSMDHLGERLSALVDGELGPAEHERALIHLAKCEACRFEADMTRRLKRRLTGLGEPEPDHDFLGRLTSLSRDGGPAPDDRDRPGPPPGGAGFGMRPPLGSSRPLGGRPFGGLGGPSGPFAAEAAEPGPVATATEPAVDARAIPDVRPARRRGAERLAHLFPPFPGGRYAVAGVAVATALLGSAFVAGGEDEGTPVVEPRLADYAVEHAMTTRQVPVVAPESPAPESGASESVGVRGGQPQTVGAPNPTATTR
ncbi:zf-HC2 domain-containing protein [Nocardiopsis sp. NPDC049922]|uniref:anti-sigma factor family protein n=1 Tax=Nocardiopsis sp. NPDC049922 TaxID=3155157 RepID=UPI0033E73F11